MLRWLDHRHAQVGGAESLTRQQVCLQPNVVGSVEPDQALLQFVEVDQLASGQAQARCDVFSAGRAVALDLHLPHAAFNQAHFDHTCGHVLLRNGGKRSDDTLFLVERIHAVGQLLQFGQRDLFATVVSSNRLQRGHGKNLRSREANILDGHTYFAAGERRRRGRRGRAGQRL